MYTIELFLDAHAEATVRDLWADLARALDTPRLDYYGMRPHVTALASPTLNPVAARATLATVAAHTAPFEISFVAAATFLTSEGVVFLAPTPSHGLISLQRAIYDAVTTAGTTLHRHYQPNNWTPHCTIGLGLSDDQCARAIALCRERIVAIHGRIIALGAVEIRPERHLERYTLGLAGP